MSQPQAPAASTTSQAKPGPVFALTYGRSGVGKTTDNGYSFPNALFLAAPGALKPLPALCGYQPKVFDCSTIEAATKAIEAAAKAKTVDAVVVDDFSFMAEFTFSQLENKFSGYKLWGKLREHVIDFRSAARYAGIHVVVNCFSRSTRFVTATGVRAFTDFAHGDTVIALTHTGAWKRATVKAYGLRPMNRVTIRRGPARHEVTATPDHRWLLADGTETTTLAKGDRLLAAPPIFNDFDFYVASTSEKKAWVRGFHYGDGTTDSRGYASVRLCGRKARFEARFTDVGFTTRIPDWGNGDVMVNLGKMPKIIPEGFATPEDVRAYVAGYLAADGHINKSESARSYNPFTGVQTSDPAMSAFIRQYFPTAGVYLVSESPITRTTNYGTHDATWHTTVEGFSSHPVAAFIVESIETVAPEEAWCLEVDDDHSLVLPFGVATGNCWEQMPMTKPDGTRVRGGPKLSGDLPEQLPAMCDLVLRAAFDPTAKPWGAIYKVDGGTEWTGKDRDAGTPSPAPLNLGEILRMNGYIISRRPEIPWQESVVEQLSKTLCEAGPERDREQLEQAYAALMGQGIDPRFVRWTIRDAGDRAMLRRAKATRWSTFF